MKKISLLIFVLMSSVLFSQTTNQYCYWFSVRLAENIVKDQYIINEVSSDVDSCEQKYFVKIQKKKTKNGLIAIGPFLSFNEAQYGLDAYNSFMQNQSSVDNYEFVETKNTFYWYLLSPEKNTKNNQIAFKRVPAAISTGNIEYFWLALDVSKYVKKTVVGPFDNYLTAEMSKIKNRKLEENNFFTFQLRNSKKAVNRMKQNIDKVDFSLQDITFQNDTINFDLNIQFPEKYFNERAFMFLGLTINNEYFKTVTLQGEEIRDNYTEIYYKYGGKYRISCRQKIKKNETPKLMIDIIISNEKYQVKCEEIELEINNK